MGGRVTWGERERERGGTKREGWSGVRDRERERIESESSGERWRERDGIERALGEKGMDLRERLERERERGRGRRGMDGGR